MVTGLVGNGLFSLPSLFNKKREQRAKAAFTEKPDGYRVELVMKRAKKREITITLTRDMLVIRWSRKKEKKRFPGGRDVREESCTCTFRVTGADRNGIRAHLVKGVLQVDVPKLEQAKAKYIKIA